MGRSVRVLSVHAAYRCRHAGACCTSNWPIPIEADRLTRVRASLASGVLVAPRGRPGDAIAGPASTDGTALVAARDGACVFFDAEAGRQCAIHRALGHNALPLACRQFPRVTTRDPRGVSVTLSHYCPTAAALLARPARVTIEVDVRAFPPTGEYSGLDATNSLPPLLTPDVLMDWDTWWELESLAVDLLANGDCTIDHRLARLAFVVEALRRWRPGKTSLGEVLDNAAAAAPIEAASTTRSPPRARLDALVELARDAVPDELRSHVPPIPDQRVVVDDAALGRYLAAHAFANWTAHLGTGLRSWLTSIEVSCALVRSGFEFRQADLILRHLVDPRLLASTCAREEQKPN